MAANTDVSGRGSKNSASLQPLPKSAEQRYSTAVRLKEEGNVFFKGGNWKKAARKYHDALLYVKAICDNSGELVNAIAGTTIAPAPATQAERDQAEVLLTALSNNLAACMVKMEKWTSAVTHATTVLDVDTNNVKALYRRGTANSNLDKLDEAKEDLQRAHQLDPADIKIRKQMAYVEQQLKVQWNKEKQKYKGMFS